MTTRQRTVSALVLAIALAPLARAAGPVAGKYQSNVTSPTSNTGATIKITKSSKVAAKVGKGNVTFQLKLAGVTDTGGMAVNLNTNTFQIDVTVGGLFSTLNFPFDIVNGKASQPFSVANSALPNGGVMPGDSIEIDGMRVVQAGTGKVFGVAGLTAK